MRSAIRVLVSCLVACCSLVMDAPAWAEDAPAGEPMVEPAPPLRNQDSPRNAAYSFIVLAREGAWDEAALLLQWPPSMTDPEATPEKVARTLKLLLDERVWLDFEAIPGNEANEEGAPVSLGTIMEGEDKLGIDLVRGVDGDWSVSATTVAGVPAMAKSMGVWWITSLPEVLVDVSVAEIELWQWIGLLLIAAAVMVLGWVASLALHHSARLVDRGGLGVLRESISVLAAPIGVLAALLAMRMAQDWLALSVPAKANLAVGSKAVLVLAIAWGVARWLRVFTLSIEAKLVARGIDDAGAIVRVVRVLAVAIVYLLGLRYETSGESMRRILAALRTRLQGDAMIDPASVRVHFLAFGSSSLDVDVKALVRTADAAEYRAAVERINLNVMDIVQCNGTGFAFLSQTVYLARDRG